MQSKIFYRAASGTTYELTVLHDPDDYVPDEVIENDGTWEIVDIMGERTWPSLAEMTHDLKLEIIACESGEIGN